MRLRIEVPRVDTRLASCRLAEYPPQNNSAASIVGGILSVGRQVRQRFAKGRQERQSARNVMRAATVTPGIPLGTPAPVLTRIAYSRSATCNSAPEHRVAWAIPK